jgi:hypothetical protein
MPHRLSTVGLSTIPHRYTSSMLRKFFRSLSVHSFHLSLREKACNHGDVLGFFVELYEKELGWHFPTSINPTKQSFLPPFQIIVGSQE